MTGFTPDRTDRTGQDRTGTYETHDTQSSTQKGGMMCDFFFCSYNFLDMIHKVLHKKVG